ncbi:MAG TPA: hypothetical protein VFB58_13630 [Chloroflexota bacterium]|nr:hypothetical protein [Chloroflexota bacterium]
MLRLPLLATLVLCILTTPVYAGGSSPGGGTIPCHITAPEGTVACYSPSSLAEAQSRMTIPPVNPVRVVGRSTGLHLTQLLLYYGLGLESKHGVNLLYGFGSLCWGKFICHTRYLVVGEALGPGSPIKSRVQRTKMGTPGGGVVYGPWQFRGSVTGRNLVITVYGSFPRAVIQQIGLQLTRRSPSRAALASAAPSRSLPSVEIPYPMTNGMDAGWLTDDSTLVHAVDSPRLWPTTCVSCGDAPFTAFHVELYAAQVHATARKISVSPPHLFYTGPVGTHIWLGGVGAGWVVYQVTDAKSPPENSGQWTLVARNIATGRVVTLDSNVMEGLPSISAQPRVVGRRVIWSTWTAGPNGGTSIIRTYDLVSGATRVVAQGGSPNTWSYTWPDISGHRAIFERAAPTGHQILLKDLATGAQRALTPAHGWNSEPSLSGDIAAWKDGAQYDEGKGVSVANLTTGVTTEIRPGAWRYDAETPMVMGGHFVLFDASHVRDDLLQTLYLYDARTHTTRVFFDSRTRRDWGTGNFVARGGNHLFSYTEGKPTAAHHWIARLVLTRFP